jgi:signal transduction histidine kinase
MDQANLERVLNLSRRMAETRSLDALLNYAMEEAMSLVGAERGFIVLVGKDDTLDFRVRRGQDGDDVQGAQDQISTSILKRVIETNEPLVLRDAGEDPNWRRSKSVTVLKLRSVMCVPLISRGETIGAIYVENRSVKGRFSEEHLAPLTFFGNQAAVSIENAALNDALEARVSERTHELEEAKAQLEHSWTEAIEANRLRTVLLGNIAHDLRSPLSIIIQSLHMLREGEFGKLTAEQADWIGKSFDTAMYILKLTDDVFDLTKIEMGGLALHRQNVDLDTFLRKTYNIGLGLPWPSGVEFRLELAPNLPSITADPIRLSQVLMNLLSNALKFTDEGRVTLQAQYLPDENQVLVAVADTGEGIPADKIGQLFQRFQQVDPKRERRQAGTGLGLAISRDLVEMHGGRLWVESTPGAGSTFQFVLPVNSSNGHQATKGNQP